MLNFKRLILLAAFLLFLIFQVRTTNIKTAYSLTPAEVDLQIQRMNMFPPSLARLGYLLETKKEMLVLGKLENNFFMAIDFREYFPSRLPYVFSPFVLAGLFFFIHDRKRWQFEFYLFLVSICVLAIIGPHAKYGPVLLYPFFAFFLFLSLSKILKRFKK